MKKLFSLIIFISSLAILLGLIGNSIFYDATPIVFESMESKTAGNKPVYNRIQFIPGEKTDLWLMQQSHHGLNNDYSKWDRLAIAINKSEKNYKATFYQLASGDLAFDPQNAIPLRARCYACHANGPRTIRPNSESAQHLSLKEKIKIQLWSLRIKTYGRMMSEVGMEFKSGVPFKTTQGALHVPLELKSCNPCHSPQSSIRNVLRMEHATTAAFLIERGAMPPFPWKVSKEDLHYLKTLMGS